jgi:predicted nucleic acid-binding protein
MSVEFVDTNIFVYANDGSAGSRHIASIKLLADIWARRAGALSTQVLAEFYAVAIRKLHMASEEAEEAIRPLNIWTIHQAGHADILSAIRLQRRHQLSWWDAMVVNSAIQTDARILWTEDLNHGERFGNLVVQNPFV